MTEKGSQKLDGLEALRGVAALVVLLHHAFGWVALPQNYGVTLFGGIFREGNLGVNIFFVLSGFVIAWSNPKDRRSGRDVLIYVLRRLSRILPLYWIACLLVVPFYWKFSPGYFQEITAARVVHDVFLIPYRLTPMLPAAWTLVFEMMFYMLFVPMLLNRRAGLVLWVLVAAGILGCAATGLKFEGAWLSRLTSFYVLQFLAGVAVCLIVQRRPPGPAAARALVWAGTLLMVVLAIIDSRREDSMMPADFHYALCGALLVLGLVCLPAPEHGHARVFRWLQVLGRYSFSIYLFHIPIQQTLLKVSMKVTGPSPGVFVVATVLAGLIAVSIAGGMLVGRFLEIPILEWCKTRIARLKPCRLPVPAAGAA